MKKEQQDINNRRKRLGQNKVKTLLKSIKKNFFWSKKKIAIVITDQLVFHFLVKESNEGVILETNSDSFQT